MPRTPKVIVARTEVVQSIQNLEHDIPLLSGKRTAVRVYIEPRDFEFDMPVRGVLEIIDSGKIRTEIHSETTIGILKRNHPTVEEQRYNLWDSMYFLVPGERITSGEITFRLRRVLPTLNGDPEVEVLGYTPEKFEFNPEITLRHTVVGFRVRDPRIDEVHLPSRTQFNAIKSFVQRAFPISHLKWNQITVDVAAGVAPPYAEDGGDAHGDIPDAIWQNNLNTAMAQLMAVRARDVDNGVDDRTHYYGMIYHPHDFFVGSVSDAPRDARPDVVGIGPAESDDGSYGGHELAHSLGRLHPGFCENQTREDFGFPRSYNGKLSSARQAHYGFDTGDDVTPARLLRYDDHHDLMTYCNDLWVSAYTYKGLYKRLKEEEALPPRGVEEKLLKVVGTYDRPSVLDQGDPPGGMLKYVFPIARQQIQGDGEDDTVRVVGFDRAGKELFAVRVPPKREEASDIYKNAGVFQVSVPARPELHKLQLHVDDVVVHELYEDPLNSASTTILPDKSVEMLIPPPPQGSSTPQEGPYFISVTWPENYDSEQLHTVQMRPTGGYWQTISVDLIAPDNRIFVDEGKVDVNALPRVRILRSCGLSEVEIYDGVPLPRVLPEEESVEFRVAV